MERYGVEVRPTRLHPAGAIDGDAYRGDRHVATIAWHAAERAYRITPAGDARNVIATRGLWCLDLNTCASIASGW